MNQKEALNGLIEMLKKHVFSAKEKQAVLTAIGILSWTSLAESRIKNLKKKNPKTFSGLRK